MDFVHTVGHDSIIKEKTPDTATWMISSRQTMLN